MSDRPYENRSSFQRSPSLRPGGLVDARQGLAYRSSFQRSPSLRPASQAVVWGQHPDRSSFQRSPSLRHATGRHIKDDFRIAPLSRGALR